MYHEFFNDDLDDDDDDGDHDDDNCEDDEEIEDDMTEDVVEISPFIASCFFFYDMTLSLSHLIFYLLSHGQLKNEKKIFAQKRKCEKRYFLLLRLS